MTRAQTRQTSKMWRIRLTDVSWKSLRVQCLYDQAVSKQAPALVQRAEEEQASQGRKKVEIPSTVEIFKSCQTAINHQVSPESKADAIFSSKIIISHPVISHNSVASGLVKYYCIFSLQIADRDGVFGANKMSNDCLRSSEWWSYHELAEACSSNLLVYIRAEIHNMAMFIQAQEETKLNVKKQSEARVGDNSS
ncbi:hypothetical protein llap_1723 [Limosa lapponica baueri]|uniref:Uncharacterized protein n=1 Tax=Limosa lapponica baueri TaxID=1758121 RepID=A0A2I0UPG1_LIMLA|nr:hypothetical protein llap_1723 [Limosa lapponica baueri]